jgi:hypothetical protein
MRDSRLTSLRILDFPDEWFNERVKMNGGLEPELPLDQLTDYANPDGPLTPLLFWRKQSRPGGAFN